MTRLNFKDLPPAQLSALAAIGDRISESLTLARRVHGLPVLARRDIRAADRAVQRILTAIVRARTQKGAR